jgi:hypothetical protein
MWAELGVPYEDTSCPDNAGRRQHLLTTARRLGFDAIAWSVTIHGRLPKKLPVPQQVLLPSKDEGSSDTNVPSATGRHAFRMLSGSGWASRVGHDKTTSRTSSRTAPCEQYTRLNVVMDESSNSRDLNATNSALQQFDIISARPMIEKHFQAACANYNYYNARPPMATYPPLYHTSEGALRPRHSYASAPLHPLAFAYLPPYHPRDDLSHGL